MSVKEFLRIADIVLSRVGQRWPRMTRGLSVGATPQGQHGTANLTSNIGDGELVSLFRLTARKI